MSARTLSDLRVVNSFAALPAAFYTRLAPQALNNPRLLHGNAEAAELIGLDPSLLSTPEFLSVFSGAQPLPGGDTLAAVYSGHQFGVWAGQLGDGRAHLLGEVEGPRGSWGVAAQGFGHDAVFAHGRWPRGVAFVGARVPGQRGHAWAGRAHDAGAGAGGFRRPGHAGNGGNSRHRDAHVTQFRALRLFRALVFAAPARYAEDAGGLRHRPLLPGMQGSRNGRVLERGAALYQPAACRHPAHGAADGGLAGGGLLPWRDEYRQYVHTGTDVGLWSLRFHGRFPAGPYL